MNQTPTELPLLKLKSFSGTGAVYTVDRTCRSCTCAQFLTDGHCKHLDELGVYVRRDFINRPRPIFSQALSGMVKSIRMRRVEDAVYWLMYLDGFPASEKLTKKAARFRIARRILIGSAEDGHSIAVMENVAANFKFLCKLDTPPVYLAAEIIRICKLENWWDPSTGGHDYLYHCLVGYRQHVLYQSITDQVTAMGLLRKGILEGDKTMALGILCLLPTLGVGSTKQAEFLMTIAQEMKNEKAVRLLRIHLGARTALSGDSNFTGHAVWMLAGGESPVADQIEPVVIEEVYELLDRAKERWLLVGCEEKLGVSPPSLPTGNSHSINSRLQPSNPEQDRGYGFLQPSFDGRRPVLRQDGGAFKPRVGAGRDIRLQAPRPESLSGRLLEYGLLGDLSTDNESLRRLKPESLQQETSRNNESKQNKAKMMLL